MYIAMNRFKIIIGKEKKFEEIWKKRDSHLSNVDGFIDFHLIKGATKAKYTLYASHTSWLSEKDFISWTKSESFRLAHKNAGKYNDIYLGHPEFEGFNVVV
ncbi:MAG: antibiotic biosynthesis monooxygenase [Rickettsiales bacterium]|nr:antibiotic biosynthesis monooxygenase [Rickettsiales bacterium]